MKFLCRIGWHSWSEWVTTTLMVWDVWDRYIGEKRGQTRTCKDCNKEQKRIV